MVFLFNRWGNRLGIKQPIVPQVISSDAKTWAQVCLTTNQNPFYYNIPLFCTSTTSFLFLQLFMWKFVPLLLGIHLPKLAARKFREAWQASVYGVTKSQTWLRGWTTTIGKGSAFMAMGSHGDHLHIRWSFNAMNSICPPRSHWVLKSSWVGIGGR